VFADILKNALDLDLGSAIRQAAAGELVLGVPLPEPRVLKNGRHCGLSPRELEVLQLIVDGKSNREIAALLSLSDNTVSVHRANIMNEINIHRRLNSWCTQSAIPWLVFSELQWLVRGSGSREEAEQFCGNNLRIVKRNKVSRVDHDDFGLRNQGRGSPREHFGYGFIVRALKNKRRHQKLRQHLRDRC